MKTFFTSLAGLIIVIIIAGVIVIFIGWSRVPDIIANNLAKKLKVAVDIGSVSLGWNQITIKKIDIGNPPGAVQSQAFKCQEIKIHAPFTHFFNDQVIIEEIDMNDVFLDLEFDSASGTQGNWSRIMTNLQASTSVDKAAPTQSKKEKPKSETSRSVYINKLILTKIDVDVVYLKEGGKIKHLPRIDRIELHDISSEGGLPMDQIMNSVLGQMLKSVFQSQNLKNMLQDFIQNPPDSIQKYLGPFKGLFNAPCPKNEDKTLLLMV